MPIIFIHGLVSHIQFIGYFRGGGYEAMSYYLCPIYAIEYGILGLPGHTCQGEIAVMDGGKCIMRFRGVRPFFSDKFDITRHERHRELSDDGQKNAFDIENLCEMPASHEDLVF